ncbi:hypothetical protein U0070_020797 [Myodes glareolus]|uniref:60S ribosomal protein L29 n=1 Tax=Myodes glareolus TaxID=447135 RepID=A0AAW0IDV9_MYOGA
MEEILKCISRHLEVQKGEMIKKTTNGTKQALDGHLRPTSKRVVVSSAQPWDKGLIGGPWAEALTGEEEEGGEAIEKKNAETFSPDVDGRVLGYHAPLPQSTLWAWFCGLGNRALDSLGSGSQDQVDAGMTDSATPQHCTRLLSRTLGSLFSSSLHFGVEWSDPTQFKLSTVRSLKGLSKNPGDKRAADDLEGTLLSVELCDSQGLKSSSSHGTLFCASCCPGPTVIQRHKFHFLLALKEDTSLGVDPKFLRNKRFGKKHNEEGLKKTQANNAKAMSTCAEAVKALVRPQVVKPQVPKGPSCKSTRLAFIAHPKLGKRIRSYMRCENQGPRPVLLEDPEKTEQAETGTSTLLFLFGKAVISPPCPEGSLQKQPAFSRSTLSAACACSTGCTPIYLKSNVGCEDPGAVLSTSAGSGDYQPCFKDEAMVAQEIEMHRCCRDVAFTRP